MSADELAGWRETTAKQSIVEFVAAVTDPDSPDFIPERDRIAVFDNDGTLWTEQPVYAQLVFALDRAAELGHPTSLEELHAGGMEALLKLLALTHAGHPFYQPPWSPTIVGMVLDDDTDWEEVAELVTESYRFCAPQRLVRQLEVRLDR